MKLSRTTVLSFVLTLSTGVSYAKVVVFQEPGFPTLDTAAPSRAVLEEALHPVFAGAAELERTLEPGNLLVLPYGSAFPADAWPAIRRHVNRGNLLTVGGRPLAVAVWKDGAGWRVSPVGNAYSRAVGIEHSYAAPEAAGRFQWDDSALLEPLALTARRVFVAASDGGGRQGIGFLVSPSGERVAAPVVAEDAAGGRRVLLNFDAAEGYWSSPDGVRLLREAARYAARGSGRIWIDLYSLTLEPGEKATATLDVEQGGKGSVKLELLRGDRVLDAREFPFSGKLHQAVTFSPALNEPGLYTVRATLGPERYTTGFWVRDAALLASGARLEAGRDYFRLDGKPYLAVGVNYFSTDRFGASFFTGNSLGGNAWAWERDFAEMERRGVTFVRTGIWLNRGLYLDDISGAGGERLMRSIEAFLHSAARHKMQVVFTLSAFEPHSIEHTQGTNLPIRFTAGGNPYTDPVTIRATAAWMRSVAGRFKDVPFLSFDLINEPSFANPRRLWRGNTPNNDPSEVAAWHQWLEKHYGSVAKLAEAWNVPVTAYDSFAAAPLPEIAGLELARIGNRELVRAGDYNLFAQDAFRAWATAMVEAIREAGAKQAVTVGQDEGGVADRLLNQIYGDAPLAYTTNHTWWRDDALLWDSLAAKRPDKPNLVGETGAQPAWRMDTTWRWDEITAFPLTERKLVLGFAAGNAGSLHWAWERGDVFGMLRSDGSQKRQWVDALSGLARFAREGQAYAVEAPLPEIALVMPQSLQLSVFNEWALEAQQRSVRALYHYARASAFAVGEFSAAQANAKLIIVPAPWVLRQDAWDALLAKVNAGATLLISGRVDADEHFHTVEGRGFGHALLTARENAVTWPGGSARLTYGAAQTLYGERGEGGFVEKQVGKGRMLYFPLPIEWAGDLEAIGRIYRFAMARAGVKPPYETTCADPGLLIAPTRLEKATLYVLASESSTPAACAFTDLASGAQAPVTLAPGRAAAMIIDAQGKVVAKYE